MVVSSVVVGIWCITLSLVVVNLLLLLALMDWWCRCYLVFVGSFCVIVVLEVAVVFDGVVVLMVTVVFIVFVCS